MATPSTLGTLHHVRPEFELLLCCGRTDPTGETADRIRSLVRGKLDWPATLQAGLCHGVLPTLYTHLDQVCPDAVPDWVLGQLRDRYYAVARRNLYMVAELIALLDALAAQRIAAMPLKGAVLANTLYRNPAHREFSDLDILIRPCDVPRTKALLTSKGFTPWTQLSGGQETIDRRNQYAFTFSRIEDGVDVDLHWDFARRDMAVSIDVESLFERTRPLPINGHHVTGLDPETLLLTLAVHGAKHRPIPWPRLKWIRDVAELLRTYPNLDWRFAKEQAQAFGCRRILFLGLALSRELLGAPLSQPMREDLDREGVLVWLSSWVRQRLVASVDPPSPPLLARARFDLTLRERLRDKSLICLRRITAPSAHDWRLVRLPSFLYLLYFPLRIARLLAKYGLRPWQFRHLWRYGRAHKGPIRKTARTPA